MRSAGRGLPQRRRLITARQVPLSAQPECPSDLGRPRRGAEGGGPPSMPPRTLHLCDSPSRALTRASDQPGETLSRRSMRGKASPRGRNLSGWYQSRYPVLISHTNLTPAGGLICRATLFFMYTVHMDLESTGGKRRCAIIQLVITLRVHLLALFPSPLLSVSNMFAPPLVT